jgi:hypothetical protein
MVKNSENRECRSGAGPYVEEFRRLYDKYPAALQKMFCSLRKIYVEDEAVGTAHADSLRHADGTRAEGANIGIRRSVIDHGVNLATWASWKEQLSFGGSTNGYGYLPSLPHYVVERGDDTQLFLFTVIAHEFGHLFDFANGVNSWSGDMPQATPWHQLSWKEDHPNDANNYSGRSGFCFYWCSGNFLRGEDANAIYAGLDRTNFLTAYASKNPGDDFAESTAYYFGSRFLRRRISLDTAQGKTFPVSEKVDMPQFASKLQFLQNFFGNRDLNYP